MSAKSLPIDDLRSILDLTDQSLALCDARGVVLVASSPAERVFGIEPNGLRGKKLSSLMTTKSWAEAITEWPKGSSKELRPPLATPVSFEARRFDGSGTRSVSATFARTAEAESCFAIKIESRDQSGLSSVGSHHLHKAIATMQIGVTITDTEGKIIYVNRADAHMHGYEESELLGKDVGIYAPSSSRKRLSRSELRSVTSWSRESVNRRGNGELFPVLMSSDVVLDHSNRPIAFVSSCQDITDRKESERSLRESEERYSLAVRGANDGIWDWDLDRDTIYYSPRWKGMLGYSETEIDETAGSWFDRVHPDDLQRLRTRIEQHLARESDHFEDEHRVLHRDGRFCWVRSRGLASWNEEGKATRFAGSLADITDLKVRDPLTDLPNRVLLVDHLRLALARAKRSGDYGFAVLFMDLDRFKIINDSLGHLFGDRFLTAVAQRLVRRTRPGDTVARFGGDEFTILVQDIEGEADAVQVSERILKIFSEPFNLDEKDVFSTASIGIALCGPDYETPEELLRDADIAMYRAKSLGGQRFQIFDQELRKSASITMSVESGLRNAIQNDEIEVFYQPIFELARWRIVGFEALVRWRHPQRGILMPLEFLKVAEETGLIIQLGEQVMEKACHQVKLWHELYAERLTLGVNVSARQLSRDDFAPMVENVLARTGFPPGQLALEITESILIEDPEKLGGVLAKLKELGVHISLDDFGTGYSSYSYLQDLPVDTLKIDGSFVRRLNIESKGTELVKSMIDLGLKLGLSVVAEGIEEAHQLDRLKTMSCPLGQGFSFARPLTVDDAQAFLANLKAEP